MTTAGDGCAHELDGRQGIYWIVANWVMRLIFAPSTEPLMTMKAAVRTS
jgi:hypothetical protein